MRLGIYSVFLKFLPYSSAFPLDSCQLPVSVWWRGFGEQVTAVAFSFDPLCPPRASNFRFLVAHLVSDAALLSGEILDAVEICWWPARKAQLLYPVPSQLWTHIGSRAVLT